MKSRVIEQIKTKYIYVIFLVIYICILLGGACYEYLCLSNKKTSLVVQGKKVYLEKEMLDDRYISKEDLISNFENNVFYDKVARKLVITSWDDILKIKTGEENTKSYNDTVWYDIDDVANYFGYVTFKDTNKNSVYVYNYDTKDAIVIKNRTEVYDDKNNVISIVDAKCKITIFLDEDAYNNSEYFNVKIVSDKGIAYVGKVEKCNLSYDEISASADYKNTSNVIMTTVSKQLSTNTDLNKINTLAVDMLRISSNKSITEETYSLASNLTQDVYAILNNGYRVAGFDPNILSSILSSDINKEKLSNEILEYLLGNNLKGLVIDFKSFKMSDKDLLTQYIKELAALLHKNGKSIMLKVNDESSYDVNGISSYIDYIIVQAYGYRTTASKTSGTHSSLNYVKNVLYNFSKKIDASKIILELAPYSILWTERAGTVINAEVYSMTACTQYIKANNINPAFNEATGQNYINYTKGIVTYKMWLEDEMSIASKVQIANDFNVGGIAIYRSGYETKEIYKVLKLEEE